ncbi:unnamed protein product [Owenia fusiformis]|uniref:Anaphase-promoting complex subunit 7 n=1 Tax=Owenia fusiformis TaxID=6347 RepID=A0A8S4Q682_OWEFU|nr:unnamed protein product [Owenia fusiformis]
MSLFDQIKLLHESELYDDVKLVGNIVLTICEHNPEFMSMPMRFQLMVYYGNSLYHTEEFKKAENVYRKALQTKKVLNKTKSTKCTDLPSEVDVKYKIHQCLYNLKQYKEAINMLEGISSKQRSARINTALAKLYHRMGMDRSAVTGYKEVLKECPLALQAAIGLMSLGVKGSEVATLVLNAVPNMGHTDWLPSWIKGHAFAASKDYSSAISSFKMLDSKAQLRDSTDVLCNLGEAHFLSGDYTNAGLVLRRAHSLDPLLLYKMDLLAYLLYKEKKTKELESLSSTLMHTTEFAPEPWVAMGYYCLATKKGTRAVYFAQKGYMIDNKNIEALLLKGIALFDMKKLQEATVHFREALRIAPYRYEAHKGLVHCYLATGHRTREAISLAGQAVKSLGNNARSLTLYASVLAKETLSIEKAKSYLEKAMKLDSTYLEAVFTMVEIHQKQQQWDKGIELLRKTLRTESNCKLHTLLGEFLQQTNEVQEALDQFSIALSIDPSNTAAREGLERVEKQSEMGMESSFDVDVEDMENTSDNDADLEGSDMEDAWSDTDLT